MSASNIGGDQKRFGACCRLHPIDRLQRHLQEFLDFSERWIHLHLGSGFFIQPGDDFHFGTLAFRNLDKNVVK
jgi:hypothetical protein